MKTFFNTNSKRIKRSNTFLVLTSGPMLVTRPILSGFFVRGGFSYSPHTYVGFTLSATPAVWQFPQTLQLSAGWYTYVPLSARGYFSTNLTYTPTLSDDTTNKLFGWREAAYKNGKTVITQSLGYRVNPVPTQPPSIPNGVGYVTGKPEATETLYAPNTQFFWSSELMGSLSVSGVWFNNGIDTGISLSTYSSTSPNDYIQYRATGITFGGAMTQYSRKYFISNKYPTIMETLSANVFHRIGSLSGGSLHMNMFSVKDHTTKTYVRNPNFWAKDLNQQFTGCAVYKIAPSYESHESYGGVLITPQHVLYCAHAHPHALGTWHISANVGSNLLFVRADNTAVSAVQLHQYSLLKPPYAVAPDYYDLCVAVLDRNMVHEGLHVVPITPLFGETSSSFYGLSDWGGNQYTRDEGDNDLSQYNTMISRYGSTFNTPQSAQKPFVEIAVSQGYGRSTNSIPLGPIPGQTAEYPKQNDIMCHAIDLFGNSRWNTLSGYRYFVWDGDSGTPTFHIYNDTLYLAGILVSTPFGRQTITSDKIPWINHAIEQADLLAVAMGRLSATTGYTISATPSIYIQ